MNPHPATLDLGAAGLAVALGALAVHALAMLSPGVPAVLDTAARATSYVLLPGWAAARRLPGVEGRRAWESAVLALGLGAALAGAAGAVGRAAGWSADVPALGLAVLALVFLAPRPSASVSAPAPAAPAAAPGAREEARSVVAAPRGAAQPGRRP